MKVCLVDTAAVHSKRLVPHWTPLGLAYIGASLEQAGHEVLILERDVLFRKNGLNIAQTDALTVDRLRAFRPDLVGISSPTELFHDACRSAGLVKEMYPDIPVVYGGHHATAVPGEVLEACPEMDIVVAGEGEATMPQIATGTEPGDIEGIYFRKNGRTVGNPPGASAAELDNIPKPARHLLDMDYYTRPSHCQIRNITLRATTMLSSRGCPFNCGFCVESLPFGRKPRFHSTSRVMEELEDILAGWDIEGVYFLDEGFLTERARTEALCRRLIREGLNKRLKWAAQVRVDSLERDLLTLMKEAGCVQLECGFETASDKLLRETNKGTSFRKNREAVGLITSCGIRCLANIMVGLPGETEEDFQKTVAFVKDSGVNHVVFSKFALYPGCAIYRDLMERGAIEKGYWEKALTPPTPDNFTAMTDEKFDALYRRAWRKIETDINNRDRMMHTTLLNRFRAMSFRELRDAIFHSPGVIPRFLYQFIKTRVRGMCKK